MPRYYLEPPPILQLIGVLTAMTLFLVLGGAVSTYLENPIQGYSMNDPEYYLTCPTPYEYLGKPVKVCPPAAALSAAICPPSPYAPPIFCPPVPPRATVE